MSGLEIKDHREEEKRQEVEEEKERFGERRREAGKALFPTERQKRCRQKRQEVCV